MTDKANKFNDTLIERGVQFSKFNEPVETFVEVTTKFPKKVEEIGKELGYFPVNIIGDTINLMLNEF